MSRQHMKYTKEEDDFIKENYLLMTDKEIAKEIGRTVGSVGSRRIDELKIYKGHINKGGHNKYNYEYIKDIINELDYKLISDKYISSINKLVLQDKDGYYYVASFDSLNHNHMPRKFYKTNPYTIQNIKLWCELNNKSFKSLEGEYIDSSHKMKWQCLKDGCMEIFKTSWGAIYQNIGCPFCSGRQVGLSNCLATKNPKLAKEWSSRNINITPYDVTPYTNKKVWWNCINNPKHEWFATIGHRSSGEQCPYCNGTYPSEDYNLLVCNPELCKEWDFERNKNNPNDFTPKSSKFAWWKCYECGNKWYACIGNRAGGIGCPQCNESKGEKRIKTWFKNNGFVRNKHNKIDKITNVYVCQKQFQGLVGLSGKSLSYDFYLPKHNFLIEYQGQYHDGTAKIQTKERFERQQEHDKRKKEYAYKNKIKLLEIWYWDFDNIEEILEKNLL